MKVSPSSKAFERLSDFAADCVYEIAMNYPLAGMREAYWEARKGQSAASRELLEEFGYDEDEIRAIRGE